MLPDYFSITLCPVSHPLALLEIMDGLESASKALASLKAIRWQEYILSLSLRSSQFVEQTLLLSILLRSKYLADQTMLLTISLRSRKIDGYDYVFSLSLLSR